MTSPRDRTILFVGHDAARHGAQLALLRTLKWLRSHWDAELRVLLGADGELLPEYRRVARTYVLGAARGRALYQRLRRGLVFRALGRQRIDLMYVNSVAALELVPRLRRRYRGPILCQVRELDMSLRAYCGSEFFSRVASDVDGYVVGTGAAETMLATTYAIPRARIHHVPHGIAVPPGGWAPDPEVVAAVRRELGIAPEAFIVGGCGYINWWKSPDLFIQVARHVVSRRPDPPVHFVWIGDGAPTDLDRLLYDREKLGLTPYVHFLGPRVDPMRYFSAFGVFLLTSREDNRPSVCFEAGALGVPLVCFEGSGGAPDFVGHDAGFVVPYLDTQAAADRIIALRESPELRAAMGRRAAEKVRTEHTIDETGTHLLALLRRVLDGTAVAPADRGRPA